MSLKAKFVIMLLASIAIFCAGIWLGSSTCEPKTVTVPGPVTEVEVPVTVVKEIPGPAVERIKIVTKEVPVTSPAEVNLLTGQPPGDEVYMPSGTLGRAKVKGDRTPEGWNGSAECQIKTPTKDWFTIFQSDFTLNGGGVEKSEAVAEEPKVVQAPKHKRALFGGPSIASIDGSVGVGALVGTGFRVQERTRLLPQWIDVQGTVPLSGSQSWSAAVVARWEF